MEQLATKVKAESEEQIQLMHEEIDIKFDPEEFDSLTEVQDLDVGHSRNKLVVYAPGNVDMSENEEVEIFSCNLCSYKSVSTIYLRNHIRRVHQKPSLNCPQCSFETRKKPSLMKHMYAKHQLGDKKILKCALCEFGTPVTRQLQRHLLMHEREKVHLYKCELCSFETWIKRCYKEHMAEHGIKSLKLFDCKYCGHNTKSLIRLFDHIFSKHTEHSTLVVLKCEYCKYATVNKYHFRTHQIKHENKDVVIWKCDSCHFESRYKSSVARHMVSHQNVGYRCQKCDFRSKWKRSLKKHQRIVHAEPFGEKKL